MGAAYFEYHAPYQVDFADSLEALVRRLLESGQETITPSLENNLEIMDVQDEVDFQMWLKMDTLTYKPISARLSVPLTLELARRTVNEWIALLYKDLERDQLRTLVWLNVGSFESPLSVLVIEPGNSMRLITTEETRALFGTEQPTKAALEPFKDFSSSRWDALIDLLGFENRGQARGITIYNEAGQPLEYFVFGYTND